MNRVILVTISIRKIFVLQWLLGSVIVINSQVQHHPTLLEQVQDGVRPYEQQQHHQPQHHYLHPTLMEQVENTPVRRQSYNNNDLDVEDSYYHYEQQRALQSINEITDHNSNSQKGQRSLLRGIENSNGDGAVLVRSHYAEGPLSLQKHGLLQNRGMSNSNTNTNANVNGFHNFDSTKDALMLIAEASQGMNNYINKGEHIPRAMVHIGPHKTATTSIQALTAIMHKYLVADGYEMPWGLIAQNLSAVNKEPLLDLNQFNLVSCLQDVKELWPEAKCNPKLIEATKTIGKRKQSIIISAEEFSRTNLVHIDRLKTLLTPYYGDNVRIVAYYRRFYEWVFSYWQQFAKYRNIQFRKSFPTYVSDLNAMKQLHDYTYTTGCITEYRKYFTDVVVFNMHDLPNGTDVSENFFCSAVPDAKNTCQRVQERNRRKKALDLNTGYALVYEEMAWHAEKAGLWDSKKINRSVKEIGNYTRYHHEVILQKSPYDFEGYIICPNTEILQWLLQTTLKDEKKFFPDFYNTPAGKETIKAKFDIDSKTKLCAVDAQRIIATHDTWRTFFQNIGNNNFQFY